jgi:hypothetical protein
MLRTKEGGRSEDWKWSRKDSCNDGMQLTRSARAGHTAGKGNEQVMSAWMRPVDPEE